MNTNSFISKYFPILRVLGKSSYYYVYLSVCLTTFITHNICLWESFSRYKDQMNASTSILRYGQDSDRCPHRLRFRETKQAKPP